VGKKLVRRILIFVLAVLLSSPQLKADELRAGAASVDITPPTGYAMWGYAVRKDQPSLGVLDPLRALVLAAADKRIALVSLDLGRAPTPAGSSVGTL
jgi:hypothetical protein